MAEFQFRLATLLRLREAARDERRIALAEACRDDETLAAQLEKIDAELHRVQTECREAAMPGEINVNRMIESQRYLASLRSREKNFEDRRQELAAEIDRRRQTLVEADRNVQILDKLRERLQERHRMEEERKEAKHLDEIALRAVS